MDSLPQVAALFGLVLLSAFFRLLKSLSLLHPRRDCRRLRMTETDGLRSSSSCSLIQGNSFRRSRCS